MKRLGCIFISLLAVLLMSHNTFAMDGVIDYVRYMGQLPINGGNCAVSGSSTLVYFSGNTCVWGTNTGNNLQGRGLTRFEIGSYNLYTNRVYEIYITVAVSSEAEYMVPVVWSPITTDNFYLLHYEEVAHSDNLGTASNSEGYVSTYRVLLKPVRGRENFPLQLGSTDLTKNFVYLVGDYAPVVVDTRVEFINVYWIEYQADVDKVIAAINDLKNSMGTPQDIADAIEDTAEQNTQNAANDSQTAGTTSSQDATTATSSLISAIGGFVGAVTNASPTNCVVNFTTSQLTIGNMDLCANPVPAYVQIIGSIILICAAIPLAIVLFNRFIGLFRSFQG